jgi:hypothetical protein
MLEDTTVEKILKILGGTTSQGTEKASLLVDIMAERSEEKQVEVLQIIIERFGDPKVTAEYGGESYTGRTMTESLFLKLQAEYQDMVQGTIKAIIHTRKSPVEAAKQLRDLVFFTDDVNARDYMLSAVMSDDAIPYVPIPEHESGEYADVRISAILNRHMKQWCQLNCILRGHFGPTVRSALILKVLEQVEAEDDRVGVLQLLLGKIGGAVP